MGCCCLGKDWCAGWRKAETAQAQGVGLGGESRLNFHPVGSKVANCDKGAGVRMGGDMEGGGFLD